MTLKSRSIFLKAKDGIVFWLKRSNTRIRLKEVIVCLSIFAG
jgi:hypothetical protein